MDSISGAGMAPRKIFEDLGYDLEMFVQKQIDSIVQRIKKQAQSEGGLDLCQYLGHKKLNFSSLPNRQGDIVLSCKSLILNLLWCLVSKGTVTPFSVVK